MGRLKSAVTLAAFKKLIKTPGLHAVGGAPGLYLNVNTPHVIDLNPLSCSWIYRYAFNGKRRDMGLGNLYDLTLDSARIRANELRGQIRQGIDPIEHKRQLQAINKKVRINSTTFQQCVDSYLESHGDAWKNAKHRTQWRSTLETYACPLIGNLNIVEVDTSLVLRILEPIWKTKTETAARLRGRIESIIDWATVRGFRSGENPARWKGHLDKLLPKPSKIANSKHFAALPYKEIHQFMRRLSNQQGIGASALEFAILTAARSAEVRGATWPEIDLAERIWIIPGERMKACKVHRVPLSDAAIGVIERMHKSRISDFIFPGTKESKPIADTSLTSVLKRMERNDITAHGFRSTFKDWASETTAYSREVTEMALAHAIENKTEEAYRRGDLFEKRTQLMSDWARYCLGDMKK